MFNHEQQAARRGHRTVCFLQARNGSFDKRDTARHHDTPRDRRNGMTWNGPGACTGGDCPSGHCAQLSSAFCGKLTKERFENCDKNDKNRHLVDPRRYASGRPRSTPGSCIFLQQRATRQPTSTWMIAQTCHELSLIFFYIFLFGEL